MKKEDWVNNPTKEMISSRKYYSEHKKDIDEVINHLTDEKSKEVFRRIINLRQSYDKKDLPEYSFDDQYFVNDIIDVTDEEIFVDCGAYNGDTIKSYIKHFGNKYKRIIAFEADGMNYEYLKKRIRKDRIVFFNNAVWDKEEELCFSEDGSPGSMIDNSGKVVVKAVSLDSIAECQEATFIKMDVEGAEKNALKGARKIIERNHPKLAICIYHSDQDMLEIPKWIYQNFDGYKLYIRHHFYLPIETVLYAIYER